MTKLREQLDAARDEYLAARYPGDLAGDVLDRGRSRARQLRPWLWRAAGAGALAAAAVWAVVLRSPGPGPTPPVAPGKPAPGEVAQHGDPPPVRPSLKFPPRPEFPAIASIAPPSSRPAMAGGGGLDLRMPSMPPFPTVDIRTRVHRGIGLPVLPSPGIPGVLPPTPFPNPFPTSQEAV